MKTVVIDGIEFIEKPKVDDLKHVIVRSGQAGVFAGFLKNRNGDEVTLLDARRLWYWEGAFTISALATKGTKKPNGCKFSVAVSEQTVLGVCEIIPTTILAKESILGVKVHDPE